MFVNGKVCLFIVVLVCMFTIRILKAVNLAVLAIATTSSDTSRCTRAVEHAPVHSAAAIFPQHRALSTM